MSIALLIFDSILDFFFFGGGGGGETDPSEIDCTTMSRFYLFCSCQQISSISLSAEMF